MTYDELQAAFRDSERRVAELEREKKEAWTRVGALEERLQIIEESAHIPDDYEFGLPSWINQVLYLDHLSWLEWKANRISKSEDVERIAGLEAEHDLWQRGQPGRAAVIELFKAAMRISKAMEVSERLKTAWPNINHFRLYECVRGLRNALARLDAEAK